MSNAFGYLAEMVELRKSVRMCDLAGSTPAGATRYSRNGAVPLPDNRGGNEKRKCSDAVPGGGREMLAPG